MANGVIRCQSISISRIHGNQLLPLAPMDALFIFHRTERAAMAGLIFTLYKLIAVVVFGKSKNLGRASTRPGESFSLTFPKKPNSTFFSIGIRGTAFFIFF